VRGRRRHRLLRVEKENDAGSAAEEYVAALDLREPFESEHLAVESLGSVEIIYIKRGLKDGSGRHRSGDSHFLQVDEPGDAGLRQTHQRSKFLFGEWLLFCGALYLDDAALAGHDEIRVGVGRRIFRIVEVDDRDAIVDAAGDSGDVVLEDLLHAEHLTGLHPLQAVMQRYKPARDRCGTRATVGLDYVAIHGDLHLTERLQVHDRAQRAADEALDFERAAALLAG